MLPPRTVTQSPRRKVYHRQRLVWQRGSMSNLRRITVLAVTTWAFVVCFAVWLMFGVIGIPIRNELGLNGLEFGLLTSTPVLTGALFRLPLGIWTDRFGGRIVMFALLVGCAVPVWFATLCQPTLAVPFARLGSWRGWRLFCRWHAVCCAFFCQGSTRFRYGGVWRRNYRSGDQYVHRSGVDRPLWVAGCPEILRCGTPDYRVNILAPFSARRVGSRQERRLAAAAIGRS